MLATVKTVPATAFSWDGRTGASEASDLPAGLVGRIYADAADLGFLVRGRSATKLFTMESEHFVGAASDRELAFTRFCSEDGLTIDIYND